MSEKTCLLLHRKSANELPVKAVRSEGIDLRDRIPWNKKDKGPVVQEALDHGTRHFGGFGKCLGWQPLNQNGAT